MRHPTSRAAISVVALTVVSVAACVLTSASAAAAGAVKSSQAAARTVKSDTGPRGNHIAVSKVRGLHAGGDTVVVLGRGFNETVGIYVALCVTPRPGQMPSPCGGGINTQGTSVASAWVSSNPPPYGQGLATPYAPGGRFRVTVNVRATIGSVDCRRVSCSIVTRADHTRGSDRTYDLAVRVRFR